MLRLRFIVIFVFSPGSEETAWSHAANWDGANLSKLRHRLVGVVLLYHLSVVFRVLNFNMLIQTTFRSVAFWAVVNWTLVMSGDFSCSSSMPLLFLVVDLERHSQNFLVLSLVGLESVELVSQILLLVKQLLEPVRKNDVGVVKSAILLVEMVVLVMRVLIITFTLFDCISIFLFVRSRLFVYVLVFGTFFF